VIVPSERLRVAALAEWQQPTSRVRLVPPGIDLAPFARKLRPDALPRLIKRRGERWLGSYGPGDGAALLNALAALPDTWQLICVGDSTTSEPLRAAAMARGLAHRVHTPGALAPASVFGLLDVIAFDREPDIVTTIAAMAAGLPIAAPTSAALAELVSPANAAALGRPIDHLATDDTLRSAIGEANRTRARERYDRKRREAALKAIYDQAVA
jgi:glycosyltransferase involved in cell wall biosynthesis